MERRGSSYLLSSIIFLVKYSEKLIQKLADHKKYLHLLNGRLERNAVLFGRKEKSKIYSSSYFFYQRSWYHRSIFLEVLSEEKLLKSARVRKSLAIFFSHYHMKFTSFQKFLRKEEVYGVPKRSDLKDLVDQKR